MRFGLLLLWAYLATVSSAFAAVPPALEAALRTFRADPPRGWSFTQTTEGEGKSTVERSDAAKPEFDRWSLLQKDGHVPTADEATHYRDIRSRHSRTGAAPNLIEQLDLTTVEVAAEEAEKITYRCRLRPKESGDRTAEHLHATVVLHRATTTIIAIELTNREPFQPALGVSIQEMNTRLTYSIPTADTPSLPQSVQTRVRGTAFWFKSLDADMSVTFSDYVRIWKKKP